jgi:hypothetical protein
MREREQAMASTPARVIGISGTVTVDGVKYPGSTGSITLGAPATVTPPVTPPVTTPPVTPPVTPPASGVAPHPAALATGHTLLNQYGPSDLYSWRFMPGSQTPPTNGSGVSADPNSPRNVSVATDGGLSVLRLAVTSAADCGVIQSPGQYPTSSGVVEALVKFSGITVGGSRAFAAWASFWLFGSGWPAGGELDTVETQFGTSFVSYHYGTGGADTEATTDPWTYPAKKVQLSPENTSAVPALPNILPDAWTYVTIAFGEDPAGDFKCDVYYNGTLYCTAAGPFVTGKPMWITAGTSFGAPTLGSGQAPYDQPGTLELQYVRVFS